MSKSFGSSTGRSGATSSGPSTSLSPEHTLSADVSVVLVCHQSAHCVVEAIESCRRHTAATIVIVDNASTDRTADVASSIGGVSVIRNADNRGFAAAVNQGVRASQSRYLLLLNPDAVLLSGIDALCRACTQTGIGAAAGMLVDAQTGLPQTGFGLRSWPSFWTLLFETAGLNRLWPHNPVNRRYRCLGRDPQRAGLVEQPAGAFLLFRREAWDAVGGLDESFHPIWFEDVDFSKRLAAARWSIWYEPTVQAMHQGGHSIRAIDQQQRQRMWYASLLRYARKHFSPLAAWTLTLAVRGVSFLRSLVHCFRRARTAQQSADPHPQRT